MVGGGRALPPPLAPCRLPGRARSTRSLPLPSWLPLLQASIPTRITDLRWAAGPDGAVNDKVRAAASKLRGPLPLATARPCKPLASARRCFALASPAALLKCCAPPLTNPPAAVYFRAHNGPRGRPAGRAPLAQRQQRAQRLVDRRDGRHHGVAAAGALFVRAQGRAAIGRAATFPAAAAAAAAAT